MRTHCTARTRNTHARDVISLVGQRRRRERRRQMYTYICHALKTVRRLVQFPTSRVRLGSMRFLSSTCTLNNSRNRRFFLQKQEIKKNVQTTIIFLASISAILAQFFFLLYFLTAKCTTRSSSSLWLSLFNPVVSRDGISVASTFLIPLFLFQPCSNSQMVSRAAAFAVRTFCFLTSSAKVTYNAPGYESLYNLGKLNSMRRFRQNDRLSA